MGIVVVAFVFLMVFSALNIMTGVIVDGAIQRANQDRVVRLEKTEAMRKAILVELYDIFGGTHGSLETRITVDQFSTMLRDPAIATSLESIGVETSDAYLLFKLIDGDHDGTLDVTELVEGLTRLKGAASSLDAHEIISMTRNIL